MTDRVVRGRLTQPPAPLPPRLWVWGQDWRFPPSTQVAGPPSRVCKSPLLVTRHPFRLYGPDGFSGTVDRALTVWAMDFDIGVTKGMFLVSRAITAGNCRQRRQDLEHAGPQGAEGVCESVPQWTGQPAARTSRGTC